MDPRTAAIAAEVRRQPNLAAKLSVLDGAYKGATGVLVTCGPSLGDVAPAELRRRLANTLTIAVKQASDVVGPAADFLCFNSYNVSRYRSHAKSTIRVFTREPSGRVPQLNRADLTLPQTHDTGDLNTSLAARQNYDDYELSRLTPLPWGPGIVHEVVIFLAVHLQLSRIVTLGWDIANGRGNNVHFYDPPAEANYFDHSTADPYKLQSARAALPDFVRSSARWTRAVGNHYRGRVYNRTRMHPDEADVVSASVPGLADWLGRRGVELLTVSPSQMIDSTVPKLTHDDLWRMLETQ